MTDKIEIDVLTGQDITGHIPDLSRLRVEVFRDWPYLYDGDEASETEYLAGFAGCRDAVLVLARAGSRIVGASTGAALSDHHDQFGAPLAAAGIEVPATFYCAESVLLPDCRGQGLGHRFFDAREAHARARGYRCACFCAVVRQQDHPARPEGARSLEPFWFSRGYEKLDGVIAHYPWKDIGESEETVKPMQFYMAKL